MVSNKSRDGISIVIPALNEEKGLKLTIDAIVKTFDVSLPQYEIVVVDDGSTDSTAALAEKYEMVRIVRHPANAGYGRSLKDGIDAASYDTIIITDADGTYPVQDIPKLYKRYLQGFDMVVGSRTGANYRQSLFKLSLRRILKFMVEWASGKEIPDINSGFRVFSKNEIQKFYFHLCDTFSFTTSLTLAYMMTGKFVSYIQTEYYVREGKTHVKLFKDSLRTFTYVLKQILYFDPLRIFFLFATIWVVIGAVVFLSSSILGLNFGYYIVILSIITFFIMIGLGLISEQIRQLIELKKFYDEHK